MGRKLHCFLQRWKINFSHQAPAPTRWGAGDLVWSARRVVVVDLGAEILSVRAYFAVVKAQQFCANFYLSRAGVSNLVVMADLLGWLLPESEFPLNQPLHKLFYAHIGPDSYTQNSQPTCHQFCRAAAGNLPFQPGQMVSDAWLIHSTPMGSALALQIEQRTLSCNGVWSWVWLGG